MKQGLFSLDTLYPNSENIEGFYKANNFSNAIAFGVFLFLIVICNKFLSGTSRVFF